MFKWETYGKGNFSTTTSTNEGVAGKVLSACGISYSGPSGGTLDGVDIKHMEASAAINCSLLEAMAHSPGDHLELISNKKGDIEITVVGKSSEISDIYYEVTGTSYIDHPAYFLVTGGVPLPKRSIGAKTQLFSSTFNYNVWDSTILNSECAMRINQYATITYTDPMLVVDYKDGPETIYEDSSPFDSVVGYIYEVDIGDSDSVVTFDSKSVVPLLVGGFGDLAITSKEGYDLDSSDCFRGLGDSAQCGVKVELPIDVKFKTKFDTVSIFLGISSVFAVGYKVGIGFLPKTLNDALTIPDPELNTAIWIYPDDTTRDIIKLSEGVNYAISYDPLCLQFADRAPIEYQGLCGMDTSVFIPSSDSYNDVYTATVNLLPTSETEGIVVEEIWVGIGLATPSVTIFDPKGDAVSLANTSSLKISPIVLTMPPAPVALNGDLIDSSGDVQDHDPTSRQDFTDTAIERAIKDMNGVGMSFTISSLDSSGVTSLSDVLFKLSSDDSGDNITYVCGPGCSASVGSKGKGNSIVNSVTYSYSDSSSYMVSVTTGSVFSGLSLASISDGIYVKQTEDVNVQGTVIQDLGSGDVFKVMCNGIGAIQALNGSMDVLRVGDIVTVTIHNNPVEA